MAKNVAFEIKRAEDLPEQAERERRYLSHDELLTLAKAADRFDALTPVLGYCGLRFGEAVALRRRHVGDRVVTVRSSATAVTGRSSWSPQPRRSGIAMCQCLNLSGRNSRPSCPLTRTLVFPSRKGGFLPLGEYRWAFDNACEDVGIDRLVPPV